MRRLFGPVLIAGALLLGFVVADAAPSALDATVARRTADTIPASVGAALRATSDALRSPWHWIVGGVFAALAFLLRGRRAAVLVALAVVATVLITKELKSTFARQRPTPDLVGERSLDSTTSYPSGHVSWTAAAFGGLACALATRRRRFLSGLGFAFALALTVWMGASRIYLGRHYLTDALGSALLGWGIVLLLAAVLLRHSRSAAVSTSPSG